MDSEQDARHGLAIGRKVYTSLIYIVHTENKLRVNV